jgi:fluoride exporter
MTNPWSLSLFVGLGGFVGSVARYSLNIFAQRYAMNWPLGTMAANVLGCLALGMIMELTSRGVHMSPELRLALAAGFCGGFTTMSSMIYETATMLRAGDYLHAALYTAGTFLFSVTAFVVGLMVARFLVKISPGFGN